jgi:thioredoxin-related protein
MKKLALLAFLIANLFAAEIVWNDTYEQAQAKAKKESKPLLVLITSEQCGWCRKFEATTLQNEDVISKLNSKFVAVHVTRDKSIYPKNLSAKMVPMNYFLDANGKVIYSMPGYWSVEDYQSILDDAIQRYHK